MESTPDSVKRARRLAQALITIRKLQEERAILQLALRRACEEWMQGGTPMVQIAGVWKREYESWRELADDLLVQARHEVS